MQHTPIYTAVKKYIDENNLRLHMPGHIGGRGVLAPELEAIASMDLTEVSGLDDLHLAQGVIADSQKMLAKAIGAQESFFLVNGSTSGVHALLMGVGDGERIMIPRNAHRSFYGGMVLSGAMPVYIPCEIQSELGIALAVRTDDLEDLLHIHPDVGTVMLTSPSYYGSCCDIAGIASVLERRGKTLMVDEAHGAHFPFHSGYPISALKAGAQAVVNSLHKTWPVLTQGACLHLGEGLVNRNRMVAAYSLLTTTSPSYPLMASIDLARDFMQREGAAHLEQALELSQEFKHRLDHIKGIRCYGDELLQIPGVKAIDPLKVLIGVQGLGLTGYQVGKLLREEYNVQVEIEEEKIILAMFSLLHIRQDWNRFYLAMHDLARRYIQGVRLNKVSLIPPMPQTVMSPRQAFFARKKMLRFTDCRGQLAGEFVAAYPPGIPCLLPGEMITEEIWDYLNYLKKSGAHIQGPEEADLEHIMVIE